MAKEYGRLADLLKAVARRQDTEEAKVKIQVGQNVYKLPELRFPKAPGMPEASVGHGKVWVSEDKTHVYVGLPPISEVYKIDGNNLVRVKDPKDVPANVLNQLAKSGPRVSSANKPEEVAKAEDDVKKALKGVKVPAGYRLGINAEGQPYFVKIRKAKA